jgi:hypothetical protein
MLLEVVHPIVVADVGLRASGQSKYRRGQTAGDHGGKSELLHFDAFFLSLSTGWFLLFRAGILF